MSETICVILIKDRHKVYINMPSLAQPTKLPATPVKRLETFGQALFGTTWKSALAEAMHTRKRTMSYWISGHTPRDLDERLKVLATEMIAEQARCAELMKAYREQLEGAV
jgi:hypothetical protein